MMTGTRLELACPNGHGREAVSPRRLREEGSGVLRCSECRAGARLLGDGAVLAEPATVEAALAAWRRGRAA